MGSLVRRDVGARRGESQSSGCCSDVIVAFTLASRLSRSDPPRLAEHAGAAHK